MKICGSCSTHNADDAVFCIGCGARLLLPSAAGWDQTIPDPHPPGSSPTPPAITHAASFGGAAPISMGARLAAGTLVDGKYAIERVIGEGGMGIVYLARDVNADIRVVLKAIRSEFSETPDFRERILAEGRVLARIDHANVVRLNAVVVEKGALYLVMQFIEGQALDQLIARHSSEGRPIGVTEGMHLFRQIVLGVGAAHAEGIIHRDLKPANILVRAKDGVAKVTDFGIAKAEEDARAGRGKTKGIIGSLWYMSPEQLLGQRDLDKRVDVYALGILLFELFAGRVPFDAPSDYEVVKLHLEAPVPKLRAIRGDLPPWIDEIIERACAKDRAHRFGSCEELLEAIDAHLAVPPGATSMIARPSLPSTRAASPRGALLVLGAALAIGATGLGLYAAGVFGDDVRHLAPPTDPSSSRPSEGAVDGSPGSTGRSSGTAGAGATAGATAGARGSSTLVSLVGRWTSDTNRTYDAVLSGNVLEFRIVDASQYPRQGYHNGEARFTLAPVRGQERAFGVEDHIRPVPPKGLDYDEARARSSCQEVWSAAGAEPLRAEFDGARLTVDLVKLETRTDRFETERGKVVACRGLKDGAASKIESVLVRSGG